MPVFTCQGLPHQGVMLTPPNAPEFPHLLEAIRIRLRNNIAGAPPAPDLGALTPEDLECSAILLNYSNKTIHELAFWWAFESPGGRPRTHCHIGSVGQRELLPLRPKHPLLAYWNTIMPGSVRLVTREQLFGNNSDIRPPRPEELHHGGWVGHAGKPEPADAATVQVTLDGVLFEGGEFAGEDKCGLWRMIATEVEVKREAAAIAKASSEEGLPDEQVLARVLEYCGEVASETAPPSARADPRAREQHSLSRYLLWARDHGTPADAVQSLLAIARLPEPLLRRI